MGLMRRLGRDTMPIGRPMRGNPGTKPRSGIAEAAERTGLMIRGLQERLSEASKAPAPVTTEKPPAVGEPGAAQPPAANAEPTAAPVGEDLEIELAQYFTLHEGRDAPPGGALEQLRERVVDGVAERILRQWERDGESAAFTAAFENGVLEKLIQRMFERLTAANKDRDAPPASPSVAA